MLPSEGGLGNNRGVRVSLKKLTKMFLVTKAVIINLEKEFSR